MNFVSTRDRENKTAISDAILGGLAEDGGLYIPESFPSLKYMNTWDISSYPEMAYETLYHFFDDDELQKDLAEICMDAFSFNPGFIELGESNAVLELFHGPTAAFKDFGARFLAACMERIIEKRNKKITVLVATSGDTGGAVASAFHGRNNIDVKVLFPKGRVSARQRQQLTCWGDNIQAYEVNGSFDDCQRMVKEAFMDRELKEKYGLTSANSINIGRLLPQSVYYVYAAHLFNAAYGKKPVFIIPSGNVGNSCAAYWAFTMGAPIERIVLATNANRTIEDYLESGRYEGRASIRTLANAMDVGNPSNMERLFALYPDIETFRHFVSADSISDERIKEEIRSVWERYHYAICPHTATGMALKDDKFPNDPTIVVSTAHPAKFESIVEPLIGQKIEMPESLASLMDLPSNAVSIEADMHCLFS